MSFTGLRKSLFEKDWCFDFFKPPKERRKNPRKDLFTGTADERELLWTESLSL